MLCKKCNKDQGVHFQKDSRGVVDAYCKECGAHIKKVSSADLLDLYTEANKLIDELKKPPEKADLRPQTQCKYCAEYFFMRRGRLGTTYTPLDAKFCPMCGRELTGHERDY